MTEQEKILLLHSSEGFQKRFDELLIEQPFYTRSRVYEMLEAEYEGCFGRRRYSSYNSFLNIRIRLIKQKRI